MASLNKVMLIGNLTRDPELRYTPKGTPVADIGLAVNRGWTNEQGVRQEDTTFIDITLWSRQAELACQYLSKGRSVYIEGRLQLDTWDDKDTGKKRSKLRVVGENVVFLSDGRGGGQAQGGQGGQYQQRSAPPRQAPPGQNYPQGGSAAAPDSFDDPDDDIPF